MGEIPSADGVHADVASAEHLVLHVDVEVVQALVEIPYLPQKLPIDGLVLLGNLRFVGLIIEVRVLIIVGLPIEGGVGLDPIDVFVYGHLRPPLVLALGFGVFGFALVLVDLEAGLPAVFPLVFPPDDALLDGDDVRGILSMP